MLSEISKLSFLRQARRQQSDGVRKLLPRPAKVTNVIKHLTVHEINGIHNINISVTAPKLMAIGEGWNLNQLVNNFVLRLLSSILAIKLTGKGPALEKIPHIGLYYTLSFLFVSR